MRNTHPKCYIVMVVAALFCTVTAHGATYTTQRLQRLAASVAKKPVGSATITQRTNAFGEVEHIGLRIFSQQMRDAVPSPTYDFLERYLLEMNIKKVMDKDMFMLNGAVTYTVGSAATALHIDSTYTYSEDKIDYKRYRSTWSKNGKEVLQMVYNMNWQLMSGCGIAELERNFERGLLRHTLQPIAPLPVDGTYIINPLFSNRLFLDESSRNGSLSASQKARRSYVFTPKQMSRSVSNLMLAEDLPADVTLNITVNRYDYITDTISVPLRILLNYCRSVERCTPYFALKTRKNGSIEGVLLLANNSRGYLHMFTMTVPDEVIDKGKGTVNGRLMLYIPLYNVKEEYLNLTEYETIK
ncbi:MAG: hypothetical protein Q4E63_01450 [Prevotellaceae bacterium]|nr:hypothetical protein [Prevotellaceae bacterium]MDO4931307.1 hypothetical protein [Prevotellaceae bacterium]